MSACRILPVATLALAAVLASCAGDDDIDTGATTTSTSTGDTTGATTTTASARSALAGLGADEIVVRRVVSSGGPQPDAPPGLRLVVLGDGTARAWNGDERRYFEITLDEDELTELADQVADAGAGLDEYYGDLDVADCGGGSIQFRQSDGQLRLVDWDCEEPSEAEAALTVMRSLQTRILDTGGPVAIDTTSLDGLNEGRAVLAVEVETAEGCVEPRFVMEAGGRVTVNRVADGQIGTWAIGSEAALAELAAIMEAARAGASEQEEGARLTVHGVVGRTPEGPLWTESIVAASPDLEDRLTQLQTPPADAEFGPPDQLVLATGPSVDDPSAVDASAPPLDQLGEFAVVPSNRQEWTREIEGPAVTEFLDVAARNAGVDRTAGQAWIAIPGFRTGTETPVSATLTCFAPTLDGFYAEYGLSPQ